jgi:magnesium-transporting ATPase (P-type)
MQYKIPLQIENADTIILWLSLTQLIILLAFWAVWYWIFKGLEPSVWWAIAAIPSVFVIVIGLVTVYFKHSEMNFVVFILNLIRVNVNWDPKIWDKWVDSFSLLDIWYVTQEITKKDNKINLETKQEKIKSLKEKLNKI